MLRIASFSHLFLSLTADVIHTVGPIAQGGVGEQEKKALRSCYRNSLKTATENAARSVVRTEGWDEGMMKAEDCWYCMEKKEGKKYKDWRCSEFFLLQREWRKVEICDIRLKDRVG